MLDRTLSGNDDSTRLDCAPEKQRDRLLSWSPPTTSILLAMAVNPVQKMERGGRGISPAD
jgi:hypothetical protein